MWEGHRAVQVLFEPMIYARSMQSRVEAVHEEWFSGGDEVCNLVTDWAAAGVERPTSRPASPIRVTHP